MQFRRLGNTEIKVSVICLGTMTWGEQNTMEQAHEQLDFAFDRGVNFIDTAEMYPVPPRDSTYGKTEEIIGQWQKLNTQRDKIVLATKAVGASDWLPYIRGGKARLNKESLVKAVDDSLKRLKTDYIDLYQLHWPDRPTNYFGILGFTPSEDLGTPIEETLEALAEIKKSGKVREFGLSNETAWGIQKFINTSETQNLPRMMSVQNPYSLLNRTYEVGCAEVSFRESCGLLAYSPLGFGVLSGKYLDNKKPEGARLTLFDRFQRYTNERAVEATKKYVGIARRHDLDPAQMALAFVNSRPFVTSNIIGATKMEQLERNIDSINIDLSHEVLAEIEDIHLENPNPAP